MPKAVNQQTFQITKEGLAALQAELQELKTDKLPAVIERVTKAREDGDLSENSAYIFGKQEQEFIEGRISELEEIIKNSSLIVSNGQKGVVDLGCKVTLMVNGKKVEFHVVGEWEAKPAEKKISGNSPLGKALLGKSVGAKVEVEAPAGKVVYTIAEIE